MPRLFTAAAIGAIAVLALVPTAAAAECKGEDLQASEQSAGDVAASILCLINERRADAGIPPVHRNHKLEQAASRHSADMVKRGYFAHTSPDGATFLDRIEATGYMNGARSWLVGENLVWGSQELSTPESMVQAWMQSPPHRQNLLRARFREIGIGAVRGSPIESSDENGMTVSSEYGFRAGKKPGSRKSRKAKARKAKRAKARARARARARA